MMIILFVSLYIFMSTFLKLDKFIIGNKNFSPGGIEFTRFDCLLVHRSASSDSLIRSCKINKTKNRKKTNTHKINS